LILSFRCAENIRLLCVGSAFLFSALFLFDHGWLIFLGNIACGCLNVMLKFKLVTVIERIRARWTWEFVI
jgi:hypothetical protein